MAGRLREEPKRLARPRGFDTHDALDAAMGAFWVRSHEATSVADLMHAMGLQLLT